MKKLALLFGAVLFSLILAEGLLRLTGLGVVRPQIQFGEFTGGQVDDGVFVTDPDLFWREPAGPPDNMHLGSHVVRVGDTPPAKTSRLRVLCIGDSCTRLSSTNSPYPAVLQQILESRAEVFNASLPGYTSHQGLAWLRKQLLDFEPDLVVLYFGWNDHWRSWGVPDSDYARQLSPSSLRVVSLLRGLPDEPPLRLTTDEYRDNLIAMADLVSEAGGKSIILLAPHHITDVAVPHFLANGNILRGDDPQALHHTYLEVARSVGTHPGVRLYDAAAQFTAMGEEKMMLMTDGIHPLDPGHVVLARTPLPSDFPSWPRTCAPGASGPKPAGSTGTPWRGSRKTWISAWAWPGCWRRVPRNPCATGPKPSKSWPPGSSRVGLPPGSSTSGPPPWPKPTALTRPSPRSIGPSSC